MAPATHDRPAFVWNAATLERLGDALRCGQPGCPCRRPGLAHCPAHDDQRPSLSLDVRDGRLLWHCRAGCAQEAVLEALPERGLWPERREQEPVVNGRVSRYELRNGPGQLVAVHERHDKPDGTKAFVWRRPDGTPGLGGLKTSDLPLFGAECLAAAPGEAPVVACEGEKAAVAVRQAGLVAVGTVNGAASTPGDGALRPLVGRAVILWPDADEPGERHMARIAAALLRLGQPTDKLRVVHWDDAPEQGADAADAFAKDGAELVRRLVETARPWQPAAPASEPASGVVPPLPLSGLPKPVADYVRGTACAIGCPVEFVLLPLLAALGAAVGNRLVFALKPGFTAPAILWGVTVGLPGTGKTPAAEAALASLRRGELVALTWDDVDLDRAWLHIRRSLVEIGCTLRFQEPKTASGRRVIPIPAEVVAALRAHRVRQTVLRLRLGPAWRDHGLVFTVTDGGPIAPRNLIRRFKALAAEAGLPPIPFHGLRHSHATALLRDSIPAKVVSERLGHSSISITLDTYSHVLPDMQAPVVAAISRALFGDAPDASVNTA